MAGVAGAVHLLVLPNASKFHTKLKNDVEKASKKVTADILIDPDMSKFNLAMDKAEQRIEKLDGSVINLLLRVDDSGAAKAVEDFARDAQNESITKNLEMDTSQAQKAVDDFRQGARDEPIDSFLNIDRHHADLEMDDFRQKQAEKTVLQKVILEFDEPRNPLQKQGGGAGGGRGANARKRIMGVRGDVEFDSAPLDAINALPRALKNVNSQLDLGIRQIYDSYFTLFSKLYKFTSKPFIDFQKMAREATTLGGFFKGAFAPLTKITKKVFGLFKDIPKGLSKTKEAGAKVAHGFRQIPKIFGEIGKASKMAFTWIINLPKLLVKPMNAVVGGFKKLYDFFGPQMVGRIGKLRGAFVRIGHSLAGGFVDSINMARMQLSRLSDGFMRALGTMTSGPLMGKITSGLAGIGGSAKMALANFGGIDLDSLGASTGRAGKFISGEFQAMGLMMRKALANPFSGLAGAARDGAGAASDYWQAATGKIGKVFSKMSYGIRNTFAGIQNMVSKVTAPIGKAFSKVAGSVSKTFSKITGPMKNAFSKISGPILAGFSKVSKGIKGVLDTGLGRTFQGLHMGITRSIRKTFPAIAGAFGGIVRGLGKGLSKIGGAIFNNPALYKGIQAMFRRISTAVMGFSRVLMGMFGKIAGGMLKSLMPALGAVLFGVMALGGQAAIGAVMALAGAFAAVAGGAIVMLPAVLAAAGVAVAVLKMGLDGVKDAMGSALSAETAAEFEEAIAGAHPAVQNLARAMREFKPAIDSMKESVQGNMLAGLDVGLRGAMGNLLPIFSEGAQKIATSWNRSLGGVLEELSSERAAAGLVAVMQGTEDMSIAMEPTLRNLTAAMGSLAEQGAKYLGPLGTWINGLSESIFDWAEGLKVIDPATGLSGFDKIMESMKTNAAALGAIFGGLFGTLGNVLKASAEGGAGLLAGMGEGLQTLNEKTKEGTEGYDAIVGFLERATEAASTLKLIVEPLLMSLMSVGSILANVATGAMPGIAVALTGLQIGLEGLTPYAEAFGASIGSVLESFAPLIASLGHALGPALAGLGEGLAKIFEPMKLGGPFDGFYLALKDLGPVLGTTLSVVGGALGTIFAALAPLAESMLGMFNDILPVFDLFAYWVGVIVGALLELITPLVVMRDDAIGGLLDAVKPLIEVIGQGLLGVIDSLRPVMVMLGEAFSDIVEAITPLMAPLAVLADRLFSALAEAIQMVVPIIPPLVSIIISLVRIIADNLITIINRLIEIWDYVWPKIASVLSIVINDFIIPLVTWLADKMGWLGEQITWIVNEIIIPILEGFGNLFANIADAIVGVVENIIKPGVEKLVDIFTNVVDKVSSIWEGLKKKFAEPIRFFLDTVLNKGLIAGWNFVGPKIGLDPIDEVNLGDLGSYNQGGVLPGNSPGRDNFNFIDPKSGVRIGLAGGEAIMRPEWTAAVGGKKAVSKMNEDARHGRIGTEKHGSGSAAFARGGIVDFGGFAGGGVIDAMINIVSQKYPQLQMTSGQRPGGGMHGAGLATDWSNGGGNTPAQLALAQDIATTYPGSAELIYDSPGWSGNIKNGGNVGAFGDFYTMAQAGPHHHHVHWGMDTAPTMPFGGGVFEGGSSGGGGGGGINPLRILFDGFVEKTLSPIKNAITDQFSDNPFGLSALTGVAGQMIDKFKSFIVSKIPGMGGGGNSDWEPGAGAEQWRQMMIDAYKNQGYEPTDAKIDAWVRQIDSESKGDPNIAQQIVDMNGTGEAAGVGLGQMIPGTWAAYRDPTLSDNRRDPWAMTNAMVRYGEQKYGSGLLNMIGHGHGYDLGGEAGGIGLLKKMTIEPERVLSPVQTRAFNDFVYGFMPDLVNEFRNNPRDMARHFKVLTGEVSRVVRELREGSISRMSDYIGKEFSRRVAGETLADNPIDLMIDGGWFERNQDKLAENLGRTSRRLEDAIVDPGAYLEAETRAREELEKKFEAEKEKAEEETKAAEEETKKAEDEAKAEREKAEDEAAETDEEKEALKLQREEEAEAAKEVADAEAELASERTKEEEARIEAAKADGSFYYGYKTFDAEGANPDKPEQSQGETAFRSFMDSVGEKTGLGDAISGIASRVDMVRSIGGAAQTATPAWMAALNGDPSGLAYNVAVGTAQVRKQAITEGEALAPSALAGALEMLISGTSSNSAPFIGEVNSGMTQAELMQTLEHYEGMRARKRTGTTRVR